jgi:predicted permease
MRTLIQDLRFSFRLLAKSPGFAAVAVLTVGLGIGANSVIFNLVNLLFLRPLPVERSEELVFVYNQVPNAPYPYDLSYPDYVDYRDTNQAFSGLTAYKPRAFNLSSGGTNERVYGEIVTGNYFDVLGVQAVEGRTFLPEEDEVPGRNPVVVVSHSFWENRFGATPDIVGETLRLNGVSFNVVGVAPEGFNGLFMVGFTPALWVPTMMAEAVTPGSGREMLDLRDRRWLRVVGRLDSGVSIDRAESAMTTLAQQLELQYPESNKGVGIQLFPEREARPAPGSTGLLAFAMAVFMALVGMVLLIACANVANLLLARATGRSREIAMRLALGASRWRLIRQMLTESVVLALLGGVAGLLIAIWGGRVLAGIPLPTDIPFLFDLTPDARLLTFTFVLSFMTGVVFGLAPALRWSRPDLVPALKGEGTGSAAGSSRSRLRNALVVAQVAVSLVVLVGAGLFLRSLQNAYEIDPGFEPDNMLLLSLDPTLNDYDVTKREQFFQRLAERAESLPEVESVSYAGPILLDFIAESVGIVIEGRETRAEEEEINILYSLVGPDYFDTMKTSIVRGRGFDEQDRPSAPPIVIVNETMAERYWPGEDALGKRVRLTGPMAKREPERALMEVVGIAADGKYRSLGENPTAYLFLPMYQRPTSNAVTLLARTSVDPLRSAGPLRGEIRALDENLPVFNIKTMHEHMNSTLLGAKIAAGVVGTFGLLGLVLAAVGIYGVLSYAVSQRTREIGLRLVLGAKRFDTIKLVVGQAVLLTSAGMAIGLAGAFGLSRIASNLLYGVSATDPVIFATVSAILVGVSIIAAVVPTWRAMRVDPIVALRYE